MTNAEWVLIEPVLPPPARTGRPRAWPLREIVNAILYVLRLGCPWRMLPVHFPPASTVWDWFRRFRDQGVFERFGHRLVLIDRERTGRDPSPSASIMDSQTARTCESGGLGGYDGAKHLMGRKRHALVDTDGLLLVLGISAASLQDRDGAAPLVRASRRLFPFVARIYADHGYRGERVRQTSPVPVQIVRPHPRQAGFAVQPHRWVAERTFAWDWPQPTALEGRRDNHRLIRRLRSRRRSKRPRQAYRPLNMNSRTVS